MTRTHSCHTPVVHCIGDGTHVKSMVDGDREDTMNTSTETRSRTGDWMLAIAVALAGCLLILSWSMPSG